MTNVDLNVHRPSPPADEAPFRRTCLRCGAPWPCPAKRDELRAEADEMLADRSRHNPLRMLDVSEVVPGCWVGWRGAENADFESEPRGGVVITIDHIVDPETGESLRVFHVAKEGADGVHFDRLTQDEIGSISPANTSIVKSLRRSMAREMGRHKAAVMTKERRMAEAIPILMEIA
jgi:hypothetical protein